jgi:hypothetical protein
MTDQKPTGQTVNLNRLEYLNRQHENMLGWYRQSEEKARFVVTINTFAAGIINGLVFIAVDKISAAKAVYTTPFWVLLLFSGMTLIGSYIFILLAVWARHRGPEPALKDTEKLWFFAHIASMTQEQHRALIQSLAGEHIEATMTAENHILAGNLKNKFDAVNWAISLTIVSLIVLFVLGVAYELTVVKSY